MGKPRLIILVRHAQSEGNKNRAIHQLVPDHRVKLTDEGWKQAEEAGHRLRTLLRPDDTLQVFTSPYRRTRETTEGILRTLTSSTSSNPSPFTRDKIVVYEEPRLREQDFGNFQPCSEAMERMWKERADYGHFFYRIPNGESAADAYDRVSGFNESLWRQFGEKEFPSVLVLVTHGLMTRVFLMKWYHWSVEYFEDLRNINHCEFVLMRQNQESGKYILESQLRTWSDLKRQRAEEAAERNNPSRRNTLSAFLKQPERSSNMATRYGVQTHEQGTATPTQAQNASAPAEVENDKPAHNEAEDHPLADQKQTLAKTVIQASRGSVDSPTYASQVSTSTTSKPNPSRTTVPPYLTTQSSRSSHSSAYPPSGDATPHERPSDDEDENEVSGSYFPNQQQARNAQHARESGRDILASSMRRKPERRPTPEDISRWVDESGMGRGRRADALGDEPEEPLEEGDASQGGKDGEGEDRQGLTRDDSAPYPHPDIEEEMWHEQRGWEAEYGESKEVGRNAVERLVEELAEQEGKEAGGSVREDVY